MIIVMRWKLYYHNRHSVEKIEFLPSDFFCKVIERVKLHTDDWTAQHMYAWHTYNFIINVIMSLLRILSFSTFPFVVGILLPVPVIVTAFVLERFPFTMVRFPPVSCLARNQSFRYFSLTFIPNLFLMVGVSLLLPVIWTVHKVT